MGSRLLPALVAALLVLPCLATGAQARQNDPPRDPASRTEASQIELPAGPAHGRPGRAYLDESGRTTPPEARRVAPLAVGSDQISRGQGEALASQITPRALGGSGVTQLSKADLDATLAQLSPAERRVLFQAISGSDICDNPPDVAAIVALCRSRLETRSGEFAARVEPPINAEERLLRGDFEADGLPNIKEVIERLARGSVSSGDASNQEIAAIALGAAAPPPTRPSEEETPGAASLSDETQAMVNALINQLGGRAP